MILTGIEKKLGSFNLCVEKLAIPGPGIYGLVGPNGSGKSTLAKIMAGLMDADRGLVDTGGLGPRDITLLGRRPYMLDDTVYNNLVYPLKLRNIKPDPHLIDGYLEKMGFSERRKQKARLLSGGEQQKLAFLRALVFRPRLIIADEAMTALDIDSLDHFENFLLEEQKKRPVVWIIISHQMSHVRRLVDYLFFMYRGGLEVEGSINDLQALSSNPHLGQYLRFYGAGYSEPGRD